MVFMHGYIVALMHTHLIWWLKGFHPLNNTGGGNGSNMTQAVKFEAQQTRNTSTHCSLSLFVQRKREMSHPVTTIYDLQKGYKSEAMWHGHWLLRNTVVNMLKQSKKLFQRSQEMWYWAILESNQILEEKKKLRSLICRWVLWKLKLLQGTLQC